MKIDNKVKSFYNGLLKDGFYLRPQRFINGYIVGMVKDLHPVNCSERRLVKFEVNLYTAKKLVDIFGFKIVEPIDYFGKCEPIPNMYKRH